MENPNEAATQAQETSQDQAQTTEAKGKGPKSQYHAVLKSGADVQAISATKKSDLRKRVATEFASFEVVGLYRGKQLSHTVQSQLQF